MPQLYTAWRKVKLNKKTEIGMMRGHRCIREDLCVVVTSEWRPKEEKRKVLWICRKMRVPGKCKGPEVGSCFSHSKR